MLTLREVRLVRGLEAAEDAIDICVHGGDRRTFEAHMKRLKEAVEFALGLARQKNDIEAGGDHTVLLHQRNALLGLLERVMRSNSPQNEFRAEYEKLRNSIIQGRMEGIKVLDLVPVQEGDTDEAVVR